MVEPGVTSIVKNLGRIADAMERIAEVMAPSRDSDGPKTVVDAILTSADMNTEAIYTGIESMKISLKQLGFDVETIKDAIEAH